MSWVRIDKVEFSENSRVVEQLHITLRRYCMSLTQCPWDAEDLAQDSWLKAINVLRSVGHPNLEAYLLRIAKNTWIDQTRRKSKLTRIMKSEQPTVTLPENGTLEIESVFHALIKQLPPLQRAVFILRDVLDYSITETAAMLETTQGAVKAALHRARKTLPAVRDDVENGSLSLPADEGLKTFLRILASAYQMGDTATMIELVHRNELEPSVAISMLQYRRILAARRATNKAAMPMMLLAA